MLFKDIATRQPKAVSKIRDAIDRGRLPHALMISGPEGTGGLALAWAAAQYILCQHKHDGDACGECPECIQAAKLGHPDLHWVFPLINKGGSGKDASISEDFLSEWREALTDDPYITLPKWIGLQAGDENKQAHIFVSEADRIIRIMSTKPYESDYRILILWLPEKLNEDAANKLLKIIEEPYEKTHFLLVSNEPGNIIGTLRSRIQTLQLEPVDCNGNYVQQDVKSLVEEDRQLYFEQFCTVMRLSYARKVFDMKRWSDEMAALGREQQKNFLQYAMNMVRENYIKNLRQPELNYMRPDENAFSEKFSPFINAGNVEGILHELELAEKDVTLNVNSKIVFFDLSLKLIMLLKANR